MNPHITYSGGITFPQPPPGLSGSPDSKGGGILQLQNNRMSMHQNKNSSGSMHGGVEDVSYGLQNLSIQYSDENKENSVSGQAIGPWTKKWRAKLQSRQLAASSNSIASGGVGNVLAAAAVVGQNNSNVQKNPVVQKKKVKKLPEEKIAERISRKNGKKAQDEQNQKKKNDIKTVVADISSSQQKKKADHLPILPAEDCNYVGRSASSSSWDEGGIGSKKKKRTRNRKKKGKKGTSGTSSFTTNAKGASVLEMLGDYAAAATATEGASYSNSGSSTYPTSVMPASCIDNQAALQLDTSYSIHQQQQVASYDAQQQYPIYTAAQGTNVLMPAGYYVPNNHHNNGTVYYNQQPNVPQPVSWASDANYYMYNGTTYATDKKLAPQTLNVNAPVFNPKMSRNDA